MGGFLYDPEVSTSITNLRRIADDYENTIEQLGNLIKEITLSGDWKDLSVKTSFLSTLDSYMKVYNTLLAQMRFQINKLENKSGKFDSLETAFS